MSKRDRKTYGAETWARGTRGLVGPWATDLPLIVNMRFGIDGSLIPRPRWAEITHLTTRTSINSSFFAGRFYNETTQLYQEGYFFGDTTSSGFYAWGSSTTPLFTGGALTNVETTTTVNQIDDTRWLVGQNLIDLKGTTTLTVTNVQTALDTRFEPSTNIAQVNGSVVHQGRAFYWGAITDSTGDLINANRIWYSDAYDYGTFTSTLQFFDVDSAVQGAVSVGANLFIWTLSGDWYVLQGRGDPGTGTLNNLGRGRVPRTLGYATLMDRRLFFLSSDKTCVVQISEGGLIDDRTFGHIGFDSAGEEWLASAATNPTSSSFENSLFIPNGSDAGERDAMHMWNGAWSEEDWGTTNNNSKIVSTDEILGYEAMASFDLTDWKVYRRVITLNAPETEPGSFYDEDPSGILHLPRILDPLHPVRVDKVIIDVRMFKGTGYTAPSMTVAVGDGEDNSNAFTLGPATKEFADFADGTNQSIRVVATPTDGPMPLSAYCDVKITNLNSLIIERVSVEYEIANTRHF